MLIALAVGLVGGSIGALYPALRAARQDAVDALSYEYQTRQHPPSLPGLAGAGFRSR